MKSKRVYVVPHSHWDREWYFTIEDSNVLLVENLDHLIEVLENNYAYTGYVFDAQSSIIDEYLKVRPENRDRFSKLVQTRRIHVGPWYTQTDSLLVNKESIIRNLLYGTRIANDLGHSMEVGYLPDIFGQNAYLPSIFNGFDIEYSVVQRGIYTDQLNNDLNFIWKSPDGQSVKANNIYFGYGPGKFLEASDAYLEERLLPMLEKIAALNQNSDHLLLPAGGDQVLVREHFPETVNQLNEKDPNHEYVLSDYETFMKETWTEDAPFTNEINGELIASQKSRIHNTIRSQRYDIKKLNYMVENKIIYILEPLAIIGQQAGLKYPQEWLDIMWKQLFDVHAHDSIGGCNSDDTNQDIIHRLEKVNRICDGLINIIKKQLTEAISNETGKENVLVLFNTMPREFSGSMENVLFTKAEAFQIKNLMGEIIPFDIISQEYLSGGKKIVVTAEGEKEVEVPGYYRTVVELQITDVPAMGYRTCTVEETHGALSLLSPIESGVIENEMFSIVFENGSVTLLNKPSGKIIPAFLKFENVADSGDSYDFSPLLGDEPNYLKTAELVKVEKGHFIQKMTLLHDAEVPADLDESKKGERSKTLMITTELEVRAGEKFVRVKHHVDNQIKDHRVRVLLNSSVASPRSSFADQAFSILERPVDNPYLNNWRENKFAEAPVPIYPLENFAGVTDGTSVFAAITKGMKEYEVLPETGTLALTLFRSVGLLGRDDLLWRPGRASGINNKVVYTPDAQIQKQLEFEYALYFTAGALNEKEIFQAVEEFQGRYAVYQKQSLNTFEERLERFEIPYPIKQLPDQASLFGLDNKKIFLSSCKRAYEDKSVIIRLFNPTDRSEDVILEHTFEEVSLTNLYERELEKLNGPVTVPAKGYVTLKLR
ncbi:glycoside hydrolase family 38 C-terminal domain-containing protein [Neobacillus sp. KR4-4]|uniref:glycoside hydrolase family 38 N-terminal domain-containing protein n=1 Tax=Neobacillus sp. KR4-4 TaxID=3344872 RepID=UPI0035CABB8A